jgi:CBS domain-containing protein
MLRNRRKRRAERLLERSAELAERAEELLGRARDRSSDLRKSAEDLLERTRARRGDLRETAGGLLERTRERGGEVAQVARERGGEVAQVARERGGEVAQVARERGATAGKALAATGVVVGKAVADRAERVKESAQEASQRAADRLPSPRRRKERSSMIGKVFNRFSLGFGAGYVLGARAGRERYDQIVRGWQSLMGNSTVQQVADKSREMASEVGRTVSQEVSSRLDHQTVQELMTPNPRTAKATTTVKDAARTMREADAGAVIVVDDQNRTIGIVTDRDIAIRSIAEGKDPSTTPVSEVATMGVATLSPGDSAREAVRLMREKAVRRVPVVEGGRPVGIVSIGDLAVERDSTSALADISAAPSNTGSGPKGASVGSGARSTTR